MTYLKNTPQEDRSFKSLWENINPFGNPTIIRMLTVAHGVFCLIDIGDAITRAFIKGGGNFNGIEFFLRLNIVGIGRFSVSLFQEGKIYYKYVSEYLKSDFYAAQILIIQKYISELKGLAEYYDDKLLISTAYDLQNKYSALESFIASGQLVEKRMPKGFNFSYLKTKEDIDNYFLNSK